MPRNFCIFLCLCCSSVCRVKAARNRLTARELLEPIRYLQSQLPCGSQDSAQWPCGHSSRRTNHQSPRPASMRRRDALTESSMAVAYQHGHACTRPSFGGTFPGFAGDLPVFQVDSPLRRSAGPAVGTAGGPSSSGAAAHRRRRPYRGRRAPDRPGRAAGSPGRGGCSARR